MGVGTLLLAVVSTSVNAGLLPTDSGALTKGAVTNIAASVGNYDAYTADIEYAVYYQSASWLGQNYSGSYIYAYQFFNHAGGNDPITTLTVGIGSADYHVQNTGSVAAVLDPGYSVSHAPSTVGGSPNSVLWNFDTLQTMVSPGQQSDILYFTSAYGPGTALSSFAGNVGVDIGYLPSPVPEPGTGMLALIGAISLLLAGAARRVYNARRVVVR